MVPATKQTTLKEKNQHLNLPLSWHLKNKTLLQCFHSQAHTSIGGFQRIQEQIIQTVDQKNLGRKANTRQAEIVESNSLAITWNQFSPNNANIITNHIMPCECITIQHIPIKWKNFLFLWLPYTPLKTDLCSTCWPKAAKTTTLYFNEN